MTFITCPACGEDVEIPDDAKAGDTIKCSGCSSKLALYKSKHEFEAEIIEERETLDPSYFQDDDDAF